MSKIVIYPLSADPFTLGHKNIVERALELFSDRQIHIIVADNRDKNHFFKAQERIDIIKSSISDLNTQNVKVIGYSGILSDYANENNVGVMIRGIRNATDLDYEIKLEQFTRNTSNAETVYLTPLTEHLNTSSSLVRMFLQSGNVDRAKEFMDPSGFQKMYDFIGSRKNTP